MQVAIAGASGLVGSHLMSSLLQTAGVDLIVAVGRRPLVAPKGDKRVREFLTDFSDPRQIAVGLRNFKWGDHAAAFCALGTTIKKAQSQEAFFAVDHDAVLAFARACQEAGITRFFVVSALGADSESRVFYNRVKGQTESDLMALGFPELVIFRPSLLLGQRAEARPMERLFIQLAPVYSPLLIGPLKAYAPIAAGRVAGAMLEAALAEPGQGNRIVENGRML